MGECYTTEETQNKISDTVKLHMPLSIPYSKPLIKKTVGKSNFLILGMGAVNNQAKCLSNNKLKIL